MNAMYILYSSVREDSIYETESSRFAAAALKSMVAESVLLNLNDCVCKAAIVDAVEVRH